MATCWWKFTGRESASFSRDRPRSLRRKLPFQSRQEASLAAPIAFFRAPERSRTAARVNRSPAAVARSATCERTDAPGKCLKTFTSRKVVQSGKSAQISSRWALPGTYPLFDRRSEPRHSLECDAGPGVPLPATQVLLRDEIYLRTSGAPEVPHPWLPGVLPYHQRGQRRPAAQHAKRTDLRQRTTHSASLHQDTGSLNQAAVADQVPSREQLRLCRHTLPSCLPKVIQQRLQQLPRRLSVLSQTSPSRRHARSVSLRFLLDACSGGV